VVKGHFEKIRIWQINEESKKKVKNRKCENESESKESVEKHR
jgi:hypothetical protein